MYSLQGPELRVDEETESSTRGALADYLVPRAITGEVVARYVRRARRLGVWRELAPETRALLLVRRRLTRPVRSRVLLGILRGLFLRIEMASLRGRALLYGAVELLGRGARHA